MTPYVKHVERRRRPYGTILVLLLAAVMLAWVVIPLSRGERIANPLAMLSSFVSGEVLAAKDDDESPSEVPPGRVRVLISGRTIPAYNKIVRDDLWNVAEGTWAYTDIDEEVAEEGGVLLDAQAIVGRVMAHEKRPGYAFTERDFLPEGTRPGLSAGVPSGKRALRIEVDKVRGIVGLQPGDRFDMVAALSLDRNPSRSDVPFVGLYSRLTGASGGPGSYPQAKVQVLVQNGYVVTPLQTRQVPSTSTTLTQGTTVRTLPVQEMVIALGPEEVAPFMEALSLGAEITCIARSGRPDDPQDSITPSSDPRSAPWGSALPGGWSFPTVPSEMAVVESISDQERAFVPVPGAGNERR